jgi:hypothetical protein
MINSTPTPEQIEALLDGPALPPPDGVVSNFVNPSNNNGLGYGLLSAMLAIATMAILFRLLARVFKTKSLRIEDGTCYEPSVTNSSLTLNGRLGFHCLRKQSLLRRSDFAHTLDIDAIYSIPRLCLSSLGVSRLLCAPVGCPVPRHGTYSLCMCAPSLVDNLRKW